MPGNKNSENFDTFFETIHDLKAKELAKMYDFGYEAVASEIEISDALNIFFEASERPKILEIFTPRKINDKVLLEYFSYMKYTSIKDRSTDR